MSQVKDQTQSEREIVTSMDEDTDLEAMLNSMDSDESEDMPDEKAESEAAFTAKADEKVQLDVEDAPFLNDDAPPAEEQTPSKKNDEPEAEEKPKKSKKKLIIIVGGIVLVAVIAAAAYFFLFSAPPEPEEPVIPPFVVTLNESDFKDPALPPVYNERLEPFWVQMTNPDGTTYFLVTTFTLSTENPELSTEIKSKIPVIRDTIYYYLQTKDYEFLTEFKNFPAIRKDLLEVVNKELLEAKLTDILYDNYVIR